MGLPGADVVLTGTQIVLAGLGIGIVIAAPVGPVNVLCIQRTVERGFWGGLAWSSMLSWLISRIRHRLVCA